MRSMLLAVGIKIYKHTLSKGELLSVVDDLKKNGMVQKEINSLKIYIGRDEELNGIHLGWNIDLIKENDKHSQDYIDIINEDCCNRPFEKSAIIIF